MLTVTKLADELGLPVDDIVNKACGIDPDITAADSIVDEDVEEYLRDAFKSILKERRKRDREEKKKAREAEKAERIAERDRKKQAKLDAATAKQAAVEAAALAKEVAKEAKKEAEKVAEEVAEEEVEKEAEQEQEEQEELVEDVEATPVPSEKIKSSAVPTKKTAFVPGLVKPTEVVPVVEPESAPVKVVKKDTGPITRKLSPPKMSILDELRKPIFVKRAPVPAEKSKEEIEAEKTAGGKKKKAPKQFSNEALPSRKTGFETFKVKRDGDDSRRSGYKRTRDKGAGGNERYRRGRKQRSNKVVKTEKEILEELSGKTFGIQLPITVKDLSTTLGLKSSVIQKVLLKQGLLVTLNDPLPTDMVETVGLELGVIIEVMKATEKEDVLDFELAVDDEKDLVLRPPVVTILGHVDHGKTTLLDYIRKSNKVDGEAGGITQHVGAYKVTTAAGHDVVILDTPGHQAFSEMRARGTHVTDIVVLVVAADDGVMPQTVESINHAKAAGVPILVAVNKIDKPNANPEKILQQLAVQELTPEAWGGDTIVCHVSALTGQGVEDLLENLSVQSEILELKANPNRPAQGSCIESELSNAHGVVCKTLVQTGTLRKGDVVLCGTGFGKVRVMYDDFGEEVDEAGPSTPVAIIGLNRLPMAGDRIHVLPNLQEARAIAEERLHKFREKDLAERRHVTLENLFSKIQESKVKELRLIVKADVAGSVEVLKKTLNDLSIDEIRIKILHAAIGSISESDVILADASDAIVIGFHVTADNKARILAELRGVELKYYQVIYELIDVIKLAMEGMLEPDAVEEITGHAVVRQVFKASRLGKIAGCMITDGIVKKNSNIRIYRNETLVYPIDDNKLKKGGRLISLKRIKDDVKEVKEGFECGLRIERFDDIQAEDVIEAFEIQYVKRTMK